MKVLKSKSLLVLVVIALGIVAIGIAIITSEMSKNKWEDDSARRFANMADDIIKSSATFEQAAVIFDAYGDIALDKRREVYDQIQAEDRRKNGK